VGYRLVAALLPAGFFLCPPRPEVRLVVVGPDQRESAWEMDQATAWAVTNTLRLRRDVRVAAFPLVP
jgi:hypothetical protein